MLSFGHFNPFFLTARSIYLSSCLKLPRGTNVKQRIPKTSTLKLKRTSESVLNVATNVNSPGKEPQPSMPVFPSDIDHELEQIRNEKRLQYRSSLRPSIDPGTTSILLFPGQGSQFVGMCKDCLHIPTVNQMFKTAQSILKYDLLDICLNGPASILNKTQYCQPAVFVASLAAVESLKEESPQIIENCISAAGFSVGEYAALVFSGALEFSEALRLVNERAILMQRASESVSSGMMTVFLNPNHRIKLGCLTAREYCLHKKRIDNPVCTIANYLYPECKVVAGHTEALNFLLENQAEFGIRRVKMLPVSGAFHTSLMNPAALKFKQHLERTEFRVPLIPVFSNVNSRPYSRLESIPKLLNEQLTQPVKWEQVLHSLYSRPQGEDFPWTYEVGPGKQLGSLLRLTNRKAHLSYKAVEV